MKKIFTVLFTCISLITVAQLPQNPEDISPLLIGEEIPDVAIETLDGKERSIKTFFEGKRTILVFYRGSWCPYCNMQLSELAKIEKDLIASGYQVIAVSPDAADNLKKSIEKNDIKYTLVSDRSGKLARAVGLAFKAPERYTKLLSQNQTNTSELILPVPSVFIVDESGQILFEYINPNFKTRISGDLLLAAAKALVSKE